MKYLLLLFVAAVGFGEYKNAITADCTPAKCPDLYFKFDKQEGTIESITEPDADTILMRNHPQLQKRIKALEKRVEELEKYAKGSTEKTCFMDDEHKYTKQETNYVSGKVSYACTVFDNGLPSYGGTQDTPCCPGGYKRESEKPKLNPHPFGSEPDSQRKSDDKR